MRGRDGAERAGDRGALPRLRRAHPGGGQRLAGRRARASDCPEACAYDHLLTEAQREALAQQALELLGEELESDEAEEE